MSRLESLIALDATACDESLKSEPGVDFVLFAGGGGTVDALFAESSFFGGGGGGASPAAKAAKKAKQAKAKLSFKKRALSKAAAAGQDTSKLEAEIAELEALIAE